MEFDDLPEIDDFRSLILNNTPLLDVRAPVEFSQGSLPGVENQPFINDEERHEIGIRYAELGQDAAIDLGHELVQGEIKDQRVAKWLSFAEAHPEGALFCWRGGMRSKFSQQWLFDSTGIRYPRIKGGYKALRTFLLNELEASADEIDLVVIGGRTGVGKTLFLNSLPGTIDLEGLAKHRGSAFGPRAEPQPTQVNFENELSIALMKHRANGNLPLAVEDEGHNIGSRGIPDVIFQKMKEAPILLLEAPLEERVAITHQEYIHEALAEYRALYGEEDGYRWWSDYLLGSLDKIRKRLGGPQHRKLKEIMEAALLEQRLSGDAEPHKQWIEALLSDYYDPMYDHQIGKKEGRIKLRGDATTLKNYLNNL
ncbi:MAG: tRNA 2-selenouridine(34) synthase MnmH [Gammaproteobacteria bacterium]|nr:tRNA 2-selenouridine(34) synthase MnmH [Gammaproteobacteria bacterium]